MIGFPGIFDIKDVKNKKDAERFILSHVEHFPKKHKVPDHLVNRYSGMFCHPVRYCKVCANLIDKYKIKNIKGLKQGMWHAYVEYEKEKK
jgi:hypothetical protein